jgi:hypothetical protein
MARARAHIKVFLILFATRHTASKSPLEATGKPASIISTPSLSICLASSSFSFGSRLAPGDCSPSLKVVSKIIIFSGFKA